MLECEGVAGASSYHRERDSLWANTDKGARVTGGVAWVIGRWHTGTAMPGNATYAGSLFDHFDEALIGKLEDARGGT